MITNPQAFDLALQQHCAGHLAEAEALYRQILTTQPNHADALHMYGVLAHQARRHDFAIDMIRRALALDPNLAAAHSNLGEVYRKLGHFDEAIASYHRALELRPGMAEIHGNLGNALEAQGRHEEAVAAFRRAIEIKPDYAEALGNLGAALVNLQKFDEAIVSCRQALQLQPDVPECHYNLGIALTACGALDEAIAAYRAALQLEAGNSPAWSNLGNALSEKGDIEGAVDAHRHALALQPDSAQTRNNLGAALTKQGQLAEAESILRRALELDPGLAQSYNNLGNALAEMGRNDEALAAFDRALEFDPTFAKVKFARAMQCLLRGDFAQGWPLYEARWQLPHVRERNFPQPQWQGEDLPGERVLVHAEQGLGDAIQFIRYARFVAARGGHVVLECHPALAALLGTAEGVQEVVSAGDPRPPFRYHVPILSLPLVFQTGAESIPRQVPYLSADPARRADWRNRLGADRSRLRVGLVWTGNPDNPLLRKRHIPLEKLRPLLRVEGIDFFSLQVEQSEQLGQFAETGGVADHTRHIRDFADTAAFLEELDLIVSVDTAVAHLAGALAKPVWTLLPFVPDWRWGLDTEESPWYPTMRLFRQTRVGDWDSVIEQVTAALREHSRARS